jgi:hypothetical protein
MNHEIKIDGTRKPCLCSMIFHGLPWEKDTTSRCCLACLPELLCRFIREMDNVYDVKPGDTYIAASYRWGGSVKDPNTGGHFSHRNRFVWGRFWPRKPSQSTRSSLAEYPNLPSSSNSGSTAWKSWQKWRSWWQISFGPWCFWLQEFWFQIEKNILAFGRGTCVSEFLNISKNIFLFGI